MQRHLRSLLFFLSLAQSLLANISYPSEGPIGGFHYQVTSISESGGNYVGTAVLTSYTYTSGTPDAPGPEPFPDTFQVPVTVNPGAENQEFRSAKCTVSGLGDFQLNSNAYWTGIVTIVGDCNLNGHHLKIDKTADYDPADPVSPGQPGNLLSYGGNFDLNGGQVEAAGNWDQRGSVNIGAGGSLAVSGSYIHQSGQLSLNGGSLEIAGDYLQQSDGNGDGTYESNCNGQLYMSNPDDYMLVGGMAQFWAFGYYNSSTPPSLTAGMLEIKGDFMQKFASSTNYSYSDGSFRASGAHRVKLSGTATQTVTFENPGGSYFNILEVTNPKGVSNSSTLSVTSGGSLALNYSGTDVVGTLYLGGVQQANGLYDATHTGGLITGSGKIQVGPFASFSAWAAANAPGQTTDQDHDHDGVPNGIEYFMGKTGNDFTADPGISPDGTVTWPKSPAFNGSYAVQTSEDLVEWTDVTEDAAQVTKNSDSVVWTRPTGPDKCFVRLLVTPN